MDCVISERFPDASCRLHPQAFLVVPGRTINFSNNIVQGYPARLGRAFTRPTVTDVAESEALLCGVVRVRAGPTCSHGSEGLQAAVRRFAHGLRVVSHTAGQDTD